MRRLSRALALPLLFALLLTLTPVPAAGAAAQTDMVEILSVLPGPGTVLIPGTNVDLEVVVRYRLVTADHASIDVEFGTDDGWAG